MFSNSNTSDTYPVVAHVDVLVVGGTSHAVSFALSAKKQGKSVYLIAPRSYLGDDICAAYRFWPERKMGHSLAERIFSHERNPPTPMHVKLCLEQSLVEAEIPFLLNCYTAGVLSDARGNTCGVVLANRAGRQVIRAAMTVDASLNGGLLQQAGCAQLHRLDGKTTVEFVTLREDGEGPALMGHPVEELPGYDCGDISIHARRHSIQTDFGAGTPGDLAQAYSRIVEACWERTEFRHQTALTPSLPTVDNSPQLSDLEVRNGLFSLSEAYPMPGGVEAIFQNPMRAMPFAESIAAEICAMEVLTVQLPVEAYCHGQQPISGGKVQTLRDALRPDVAVDESLALNLEALPVLGEYDVVVVGGGTGGAPAAISAARAGARTLVLELTSGLGGVGTMGQIAKYWCGNRVGFTSEIDAGVNALEYKDTYKNSEVAWSVAAKCAWFHRAGFDLGCTYWFNTLCVGTLIVDGKVTGLVVAGPYGYGLVKAGAVVDGTGSADIAASAGAPTVVIGKEHVAVQGTGLAGVHPGRNYHNSDHNFSDDTDVVDSTSFFVSSKLKFKGDFDCGELIDSRERRQIVGDMTLSPVDILYRRRFPDTVCVATSNFDSHGFTVDPTFMLIPPNKEPLWADIPIGCFLPKGLEGVLVTGLGMSAHRDALPVIRMQADVQNQGYVAGRVAALSALRKLAIREVPLAEIQQHLVEIGSLPERVLTDEDTFPVSDAAIQAAIDEHWDSLSGVALLLHERERTLEPLLKAYRALSGQSSKQSLRYAQILALLGEGSGEAELIEAVESRDWDAGWRFQGMHQFGMNMSELDALLVCLGSCGSAAAWPCLMQKLKTLPEDAEFSHIRALTMSIESLYARCPNPGVPPLVTSILKREGYQGHAHLGVSEAQSAISDNINENQVRDRALRELHLARLLYHCGDSNALGLSILRKYAGDCRGHFARHARALLSEMSG